MSTKSELLNSLVDEQVSVATRLSYIPINEDWEEARSLNERRLAFLAKAILLVTQMCPDEPITLPPPKLCAEDTIPVGECEVCGRTITTTFARCLNCMDTPHA